MKNTMLPRTRIPKLIYLLIFCFFSQQFACKIANKKAQQQVKPPAIEAFSLLDSAAASLVIIKDEQEGFFDKINITDMQIQMSYRPEEGEELEREAYLQKYKAHLQADTRDFNKDEAKFVESAMSKAKELCAKIAPKLCDQPIKLIKVAGNHYGTAYYTRENLIAIPQALISKSTRDMDGFTKTMLHELFHIYSRYHPLIRKDLYALIGFRAIENLEIPAKLKERILLNPDGLDLNYAINIKDSGIGFVAVPIIYSNENGFQDQKVGFFSYLEFNLFELQKSGENWTVRTDETGVKSRLEVNKLKDFFTQIGPNTNYIIHPDEILADNFALLALSKEDETILNRLKPEGQRLLKDIEAVLQR